MACARGCSEGTIQRGEQCLALRVVLNAGCKRLEAAKLLDFLRDGITLHATRCRGVWILVTPLIGGFVQRLVILVEFLGQIGNFSGFIEHSLEALGHRLQRTRARVRAGREQLPQHQ